MKSFTFTEPAELEKASELLSYGARGYLLAGGTDLVTEMKQGIIEPDLLVSASQIQEMSNIEWDKFGLKIGSMVTLSEIASSESMKIKVRSLVQAAESIATPQIRNIATLGGNLCQRPRCWYYRNSRFNCMKKGGTKCFAVGGSDKYHAILGGDSCYIVHPSDSAVALVALKAKVEIYRKFERVTIPIGDFFTGPEVDVTRENILEPGDILISIHIPNESMEGKSVFLKAKERKSMDFAIVSVASMVRTENEKISQVGLAVGGVAPVPWKLDTLESKLVGLKVEDVDLESLCSGVFKDAKVMGQNGYKLQLAQTYLERGLNRVLGNSN
ncbi:xanthine dehydrogenase family protein subunit M [Chloroflexi bacterium]|nr:xanthine dehydrogenase family protein subunit M [Chloroflexota bacterium]